MAADAEQNLGLEIAHVLFIDIVGYSKKLVNEQTALVKRLNEMVRQNAECRKAEAADRLIKIPTGDGMALAFFTSPDAPVRCAMELSRADKEDPKIELRMGIHSGPVDRLADVNERTNVAGSGINLAQRVMDCGDAGHILLSKRAADDLGQYAEWRHSLHDLGEVEVKHGVCIALTNFSRDGIGNAALPGKIKLAAQKKRRRKVTWLAAVLATLLLAGSLIWLLSRKPAPKIDPLAGLPEKAVAVLPFENLSMAKEDAFFAEGIQDDVLTSLGKVKELTVIARASVLPYRGDAAAGKLKEIAQSLRVSHVVLGSVRRLAERVVINVQLVDARNDQQLWSERYDRTIDNMLSLQGELAVEIARQLRAKLSPAEALRVETKPTENPEAYVLYLRAREIENASRTGTTGEEIMKAMQLYQQAIALDPKFALARARLSLNRFYFEGPEEEQKERAEAEESLRLNPNLGEGHLALAAAYAYKSNWAPALAALDKAEELMPSSIEVWQWRATIYRAQNKIRERIAALQRAEILDPRDGNTQKLLYFTFMGVRQWDDAMRTSDKLEALVPDHLGVELGAAKAEFRMTGSLEPLKRVATQPPPGADADYLGMLQYQIASLERDYETAGKLLERIGDNFFESFKAAHLKSTNEALLAVARGADGATVKTALLAARAKAEQWHPASGSSWPLRELALIDAFLGRKEQAISECRRMMEEEHDVFEKNSAAAYLALVYARTGETDEAIKLIEKLLTLPGRNGQWEVVYITLTDLKLRWVWDPLRKDPRFQKFLAGPEPKTVY